ncbi:hypothetical protein [Paracoccus sp. MC1862]|uniref:hypothetical protein n=1 Tax=Paracoccus sp. MC1862 TaxID=2760307 RepID=UPI001601E8F7|nr:hypothetical protein [Paracoccus sp. MC1862]MBB1499157.1 hypothetical protein [Paracoccus sp. MC1862]QQO46819.1 hypothetical protein JGR78_17730 [Paracoccus sp. MC1862]
MFVIHYLITAVAVISGLLAWAIPAGYSAWQIAGLAFVAVLALQAAILAFVVFAAARRDRACNARKRPDQLVILPR